MKNKKKKIIPETYRYSNLDLVITSIDELNEVWELTKNFKQSATPFNQNTELQDQLLNGKLIILHFLENEYKGWNNYPMVKVQNNSTPLFVYNIIKDMSDLDIKLFKKIY